MARPCPVPLPTGFVVKNGSKIRPRIASGIPAPVSAISMIAQPGSLRVVMAMVPLRSSAFLVPVASSLVARSSMACAALTTRFKITWFSSLRSAITGGRSRSKKSSVRATYFHSPRATVRVVVIAWVRSMSSFSFALG